MTATASAVLPEKEEKTGFEKARFVLKEIPIDQIVLGKYALRQVNYNSVDYKRLRDSIADTEGPMNAIIVQEIDHPTVKGKIAYGLIDGLHRYACCSELGFEVMPARVIAANEADVMRKQIIANRSRIETRPVEYTKQLHRMLNADPTLTLDELATDLFQSVEWLTKRLSLANLHKDISKLVDEGLIPLAHAYALAKLKPQEEQLAFQTQAQTQTLPEFVGQVQARIKELRAAFRAGRSPSDELQFVAVPHLRSTKEIKTQLEFPTLAPHICKKMDATTVEEGFRAGIAWVLSMDPDTIERSKQQAADRKKENEEKAAKKKEEKLRKQLDVANKQAMEAGIIPTSDTNTSSENEDDEDEDEEDEDEE